VKASQGTRWGRRPQGRRLRRVVREGASPGGRSRKGLRREQARSGIGWSVLGARGRKSVAEVGTKHLSPWRLGTLRSAQALRGRQGRRGDSLKRPVGLWRGRPRLAAGDRVPGKTANANSERVLSTRAARSGSIRWKASWFVRTHRPNPTVVSGGPGAMELSRDPQGLRSARRGAAQEAVCSGPSCDRGRQRFARQVRLPQPMGAGGRRPTKIPSGDLRAAPGRSRLKLSR